MSSAPAAALALCCTLAAGAALAQGLASEPERLTDATARAPEGAAPLELLVRGGDRFRAVRVDSHGGLRDPRLERDPSRPALLDDILAPRR